VMCNLSRPHKRHLLKKGDYSDLFDQKRNHRLQVIS
jgi:hypothetical protein